MEAKADEANRILIVEMRGIVSEAEIDATFDKLQERYPQVGVRVRGGERGGVDMLLDWEHLEGWEKGAKTIETLTGKMLSDVVNRVAIVAEEKWRGEEERIADIAKKARVRFFSLAARDHAWIWLTSD
jgi:hypothetical protein